MPRAVQASRLVVQFQPSPCARRSSASEVIQAGLLMRQ